MSPILVRPVREQLEHDRLIRLLQVKLRRKFDAGINPGAEQNVPVGAGPRRVYPDLVLLSLERGRRLQGVVEVETGESVNHLEALAQWTHLAKLRDRVSPVCAGRHGRCRAPAVRRQPRRRQRNLELSHHRRSGAVHARAPQPRSAAARAPPTQPRRSPRSASKPVPPRPAAKPAPKTVKGASQRRAGRRRPGRPRRRAKPAKRTEAEIARALPEILARQARIRALLDRRAWRRRGEAGRRVQRLLFWFRTPPQVKVGRLPFTDDVRRAIEAQNPGRPFDWPRLLATPIPPPDAEHWRERRRAEKAAKQAAREAGRGDEAAEQEDAAEPDAARRARSAPDSHC